MKQKYLLLGLFIAFVTLMVYKAGQTKVIIEFSDLEPFKHNVIVYYKGFELGHTGRVHPGPDYTTTRVTALLRLKGLKLPANTTAVVRRKDKKDYIDLEYPSSPYLAPLKNNSIIKGEKGLNFESFFQDQAANGGFDQIKNNLNHTINSAGEALLSASDMFKAISSILNDIKPIIVDTFSNLETASENIANATEKIDSTLSQGQIDNTLTNINKTSENLANASENISGVTNNLNKNSINLLNCLINEIRTTVDNVNKLVVGLGNTFRKRFSGIRIMFGKGLND